MTLPVSAPRFLRTLEQVAVTLALAAGVAVAVLAVLISIDIVGRDFFGRSIQGTDEIGGYVLAFVGSLGMALTLIRRGHPRIDLFFRFFPPLVCDALNALAQITMAGFAAFMAWYALSELQVTLRFGAITNTPLQTPLWVPQAIWVAGMMFFALTATVTMIHALYLLSSNPSAVGTMYGSPTIDEEIDQYVDVEGDDARG